MDQFCCSTVVAVGSKVWSEECFIVLLCFTCPLRSEMAAAVERGVLSHCSLSYSRFEAANTHYIQDAIRWNKEELGALIMERNAVVYVCG